MAAQSRPTRLDARPAIWYANAGPILMMNATSIFLTLAQATAPEAKEQQLLDVDGTLFIQFGLFLICMLVLTQFLWKPYLRVRAERVTRVEGHKEEARRLEAEAAARLNKVEAELAEARRAGSAERARVRSEAVAREQKILAAAQTQAQQSLGEARARIEAALATERVSVASRAEALGLEAAERILGRRIAA
jgi:F0F1-type ATP synthase membrane subunit b/b'